jgi:hypothetical protein
MFQHYATPFDKDKHYNSLFHKEREYYSEQSDFYAISVVDRTDNSAFQRLVDSGKQHGIIVTPIITTAPIGHGSGFGAKIKGMFDYIQDKKPNDIILFTDGFDVLITGTKNDICHAYQAFRTRLFFLLKKIVGLIIIWQNVFLSPHRRTSI